MSRRKTNPAGTAAAAQPTAADDPPSPDPQASLSQKVPRVSAPEDNTGQRSSRIAAFADEMLALAKKAEAANLPLYVVQDAGRTEVAAGTSTVLAIGPGALEAVNAVTGDLKLLR